MHKWNYAKEVTFILFFNSALFLKPIHVKRYPSISSICLIIYHFENLYLTVSFRCHFTMSSSGIKEVIFLFVKCIDSGLEGICSLCLFQFLAVSSSSLGFCSVVSLNCLD